MAIEKMLAVNIAGLLKDLDEVLLKCCQSKCFHIEQAITSPDGESHGLKILNEENPYTLTLRKLINLSQSLNIKFKEMNYSDIDIDNLSEIDAYINKLQKQFNECNCGLQDLNQDVSLQTQTLKQISHLEALNIDFERLFSLKHVKVRIGKLPVDSYPKLAYYDDKDFFFVPLETGTSYVWGMYFAPNATSAIVDEVFKSLYFERIRVPDFVKGTPKDAYEKINMALASEQRTREYLEKQIEKLKAENEEYLNKAFVKLKFLNDTFELRKMVATVNGNFYMTGFIPAREAKRFEGLFDTINSVSIIMNPPDADSHLVPPTKLRNGFFSNPFAMLVEMYGLPAYNGINPTSFFAITYTLLFGIMFGDLGQGAVIFLIGLIMSKFMKNSAGGILSRVGLSSMFFGFMYGSVFGFEELLDPVYEFLGWGGKPLHVFEQTNFILLAAVALGVVLITISITLNIILGFRQKNYEKAIFGSNGIVGLVFYLSVAVGASLTLLLDIKVFTLPYVLGLIVLPLLLMFFRTPLSNYMRYRKTHLDDEEKEGIGTFIAENFFELFEFLLSYVTNTMSFLRVGGFILSHAGMMMVVMTLAEGVSAGVSPIIIVIGNIFVMGMEGMIVAIQSIRLEFYEIFSRFYDGDGKPFVPVRVNLDTDIE